MPQLFYQIVDEDKILINNTKKYVKNFQYNLPYKESVVQTQLNQLIGHIPCSFQYNVK